VAYFGQRLVSEQHHLYSGFLVECWNSPKRFQPGTKNLSEQNNILYHPVHCWNSGHFYTEDLPNIILFGITRVCQTCRPSFMDVTNMLASPSVVTFAHCNDGDNDIYNTGFEFNCFMPWVCETWKSRVQNYFGRNDLIQLYSTLLKKCKIFVSHSVPKKYDVIIFNREKDRKVGNMELLVGALQQENITVFAMNRYEDFSTSSSQCDIFRFFQDATVVIGPYGSDITYPMILEKAVFALMSKWATEPFYDIMHAQLGLINNAFRIIYTGIEAGSNVTKMSSFEEWRRRNFLQHNLVLTSENVADIIVLVKNAL